MKIKDSFTWYREENKELDFSKIESIDSYTDLQGCTSDLSSLESIGGSANLRGCNSDLSSLESIGGYADLQGCNLDLSSLESIGSYADLRGCNLDLKKSLAKTLKKCGDIYIEFRDKPLTLREFKRMFGDEIEEMTVEEVCKELGREIKIVE